MRCRNRIDNGAMHARCYLEEGHEPQICRTYDGKPFTPTHTHDDKLVMRMEAALLNEKPKSVAPIAIRTFRNNTMALALRAYLIRKP